MKRVFISLAIRTRHRQTIELQRGNALHPGKRLEFGSGVWQKPANEPRAGGHQSRYYLGQYMNRSDLIKELSDRFKDINGKDTEFAVRLIFEAMSDALVKGHRIEIRNFGVLHARTRLGVTYRNPRTGERLKKKSMRFVRFKVGKNLQKRLSEVKSNSSLVEELKEVFKSRSSD